MPIKTGFGSVSPRLNGLQKMDGEIAAILNEEALRTAHGPPFSGNMIHCLRKRWRMPTVKINGNTSLPKE